MHALCEDGELIEIEVWCNDVTEQQHERHGKNERVGQYDARFNAVAQCLANRKQYRENDRRAQI